MDSVVIPQQIAEYVLSEKNRLSKVEAYIYLVLKVNGETTSYGKLAEAWKWPTSATVSRFIAELQNGGLVEVETGKAGTKITLRDIPKDTPKDTPKPAKTKGKRKTEDIPKDTPKDTPKQVDMFGNECMDSRSEAVNKRFKVLNYDIDFSFVEKTFEDAFFRWLKYKQGRGEKYKNLKSLRTCYDKMKKDSKNSPSLAMKMIEQSEANNYAGLFPLKENYNNGLMYGQILKGDRTQIINEAEEW